MDNVNSRPGEYYTNRLAFLRKVMQSEGYNRIERVSVEVLLEKTYRLFGRVEMETVNVALDIPAAMRFAVPQPNGPLSAEEIEEVTAYCKKLGLCCSSDKSTDNERIFEFKRQQ